MKINHFSIQIFQTNTMWYYRLSTLYWILSRNALHCIELEKLIRNETIGYQMGFNCVCDTRTLPIKSLRSTIKYSISMFFCAIQPSMDVSFCHKFCPNADRFQCFIPKMTFILWDFSKNVLTFSIKHWTRRTFDFGLHQSKGPKMSIKKPNLILKSFIRIEFHPVFGIRNAFGSNNMEKT